MVRSLWKTLAVGAFAWLLAPSAPAQTPQHDPSPQSNTYQRDSATTRTSTHESSTIRRGSSVSDDTTQMDHAKKSRKHKSMEMKHSKKSHKGHKGSGSMEDSTSIHHRGSGDMNDQNDQKRHSGTTMDTSSTRHRGNMDYDRSGAGDTSGWNNRNRSDYPQGTSGGNTQQLDSIHHRGHVGGDSAGFNDRNNSATMDTVMSGSDSSRINRRGGKINDNTNWNTTSDSLNRWSDSVRHRGSLDSSYQNQYDSSSHRGGIYHRGAIRDSAGNPEMNNPDLDRTNPDMNRSKDGMRDSSRLSPPEQRDGTDSLHHSMGINNNASMDKMALATYSYQEKDSYDRQDTSMSGRSRHSGTQRRGGMDKEGKNEDMNNNNNSSSEFSGSFKASLVNADTKAMKGEATVKVSVNGIKIVDPAEMNEKAHKGEGHIHYQLDDGPEIATTALKLSFHKLSAGEHTIKVMLAGNDHNPLGPQETLKVTVPEHGQE